MAVVSLLVGNVVTEVRKEYPEADALEIATCLSITAGAIVTAFGLLRIGWIVDLIPLTSLSAFMTGSSITICVSQVPTIMGIPNIDTRDHTYLVVINILKDFDKTTIDAALGLTALALLYALRYACSTLAHRYVQKQKLYFFLSTLRTVFVILLYTFFSWLINMSDRENPKFSILRDVPRGFQQVGLPKIRSEYVSAILSFLPATVIVLLIEHIAISKSFGRLNNYTINPSQEMVAIGVTNILNPFVGGYPATGSFTRTAIKSRAGVRTPLAGVITAALILLAIYVLPPMFYYIPRPVLAAVIIHAVIDLITSPNTLYQFWRVNPLEVFVFVIGVIISIFFTIEEGIYTTVGLSAAILLFRILKATGRFLGKVKVHSVLGDYVIGDHHRDLLGEYGTFSPLASHTARNVFLPIGHSDGSNPEIGVDNPYPGIFIYRFREGFNYPNASHTLDHLTTHILANTRRTNPNHYAKKGDRPWNDPGPSRLLLRSSQRKQSEVEKVDGLPTLKAIIFDFSSVNNVDITSVQSLIDVRNQLDRYAAPDVVDWHIACINNRWTKRALVSAGFGYPTERSDGLQHRWRSIFSVAEMGSDDSPAEMQEGTRNADILSRAASARACGVLDATGVDIECGGVEPDEAEKSDETFVEKPETPYSKSGKDSSPSQTTSSRSQAVEMSLRRKQNRGRPVAVHAVNRPLFHVDLTSALQSAISNAEARAEGTRSCVPRDGR